MEWWIDELVDGRIDESLDNYYVTLNSNSLWFSLLLNKIQRMETLKSIWQNWSCWKINQESE
jgi:hypothetical protein